MEFREFFDDYNDLFRWPFVSYTLGGYNNLCNGIFSFGRGSPFLKFAMVTLASAARGLLPLFLECPLPLTQTSKVVDLLSVPALRPAMSNYFFRF